jgi:uncharacterized protein (DUF2141 family)
MARPGLSGIMIRRAALLLLLLTAPAAAEPGVVEVTITGVRNANGHVLVAICDSATFLAPTCPYHGRAQAHAGSVMVRITGVPPGVYAVQAYHDENDNNRLDRSLLGLPEEGMGFSNNAKMRFGPPAFADAAVQIQSGGGAIQFALRYFD